MSEFLESHPLLKEAAVIARTFRIDPLAVLNSTLFEWNVRRAASSYVLEEERKAAESAKKK